MDSLCYRLFQDWPELVLELAGLEEGRQEGWREERLRIARMLAERDRR